MTRAFHRLACCAWLGVAAAGVGCASRGFVRPEGPTVAVADATALWDGTTSRCRALQAFQTQLRLSGRVAEQRVPALTVGAIVTRDGRIGLDARLSGTAIFALGGDKSRARLLLPQDHRVVEAPPADILDALVGVAWEPSRLMAVLSGCVAPDAGVTDAAEFHNGVIAVHLAGQDVAYLVRLDGRPIVRAASSGGLDVDYRRYADGWPAEIVIQSREGQTPAVFLTLRIEAALSDPTPAPNAFSLAAPTEAVPMSIQELKAGGPFGDRRQH